MLFLSSSAKLGIQAWQLNVRDDANRAHRTVFCTISYDGADDALAKVADALRGLIEIKTLSGLQTGP